MLWSPKGSLTRRLSTIVGSELRTRYSVLYIRVGCMTCCVRKRSCMSSRKFAPPAPACRVCHSSHVPCLALCLLSVLHFHWLISSVSIAISGIYTSALSPFLLSFFQLGFTTFMFTDKQIFPYWDLLVCTVYCLVCCYIHAGSALLCTRR